MTSCRTIQEQKMARPTVMRMLAAGAALSMVLVGCARQPQASPTPTPARQSVAAPAAGPEQCPVTMPNGNGPPGERRSSSHHGNGALWTGLPADDGIDRGGVPEPDGSTSQRYLWWTAGTEGGLAIEGRRLDTAVAAQLRARIDSGVPDTPFADVPDGSFWSSSISFPTEGCWQVTGRVGTASLTFVVFMAN
jgi:hypothetical protein